LKFSGPLPTPVRPFASASIMWISQLGPVMYRSSANPFNGLSCVCGPKAGVSALPVLGRRSLETVDPSKRILVPVTISPATFIYFEPCSARSGAGMGTMTMTSSSGPEADFIFEGFRPAGRRVGFHVAMCQRPPTQAILYG